ncbi:MAG: YjbQ family protein [Thermoleophilia bacterium]|nr:YjbQ family protein [Thermoleophilia bacterium]
MWVQERVRLAPRPRGVHLVTREVVSAVPDLARIRVGLAHVFIRHTSASLTLNENASPDVRRDLDRWLDRAVPDDTPWFEHVLEGPDDMPAHVKSVLVGAAVSFPLRDGRPLLGTWQGLYLCEHRDDGGPRELVVTAWGEPAG